MKYSSSGSQQGSLSNTVWTLVRDETPHGVTLFNSGRFFDAHEAFEEVWREVPDHELIRRHLQGMVQMAVAFHHQSTGNREGARSVLERAIGNLNGAEESFPGLDWEGLRAGLNPWCEYLGKNPETPENPPPELPQLLLRGQSR